MRLRKPSLFDRTARFEIALALGIALSARRVPFICDAQALDALVRIYPHAADMLTTLVDNAIDSLDPRQPLEVRVCIDHNGILALAVQQCHDDGWDVAEEDEDCPIALSSVTIPFRPLWDTTPLFALKWLLTRLSTDAARTPLPSMAELAMFDRLLDTQTTLSAEKSPVASHATAGSKAQILIPKFGPGCGRSALRHALPESMRECQLMDTPDVILLDDSTALLPSSHIWTKFVRRNPSIGSAHLVLVSDRDDIESPPNAHKVRWSQSVGDFQTLLASLPPRTERVSETKTQRQYAELRQVVRKKVGERAERRRVAIARLAEDLGQTFEKAREILIACPDPSSAALRLPHVHLARHEIEKAEVNANTIASDAFGWSGDHLHRWLRESDLPLLKPLITAEQLELARRLLANPDVEWDHLNEALGFSREYLRKWLARHCVALPPRIDDNSRLSRLWSKRKGSPRP